MKRTSLLALALALTVLLCACAPAGPSPSPCGPSEDRTVTIYVSHKKPVYLPIIREFEERTGIWVEVVSGGSNELLTRLRQEQEAPQADILFGGGVESISAYEDCFTPYESSESPAILERYRDPESCWTPFSALPIVLIYNEKLVSPQALTGWEDLLNPQFQGRIAFADPAVSGSSFTALATFLGAMPELEAPMQALMLALDGRTLDGSGDVVSAVVEGKALVGITLEETAVKAIAAGNPLGIVYPREGTSCLPDGIAIVKNCPHPENARAFLDFAVSLDVQNLLVRQESRRSVRTDAVSSRQLPPLEDLPLLPYDPEQACANRDAIMTQWSRLKEGEQ